MERFEAGVQFGDWSGTAEADGAATNDLGAVLKARGLVPAGQFLVGFDVWLSEATGAVGVKAYFAEGDSYDDAVRKFPPSGPVAITEVEVPLTLDEFLKCFKRFNIRATRQGMDLNGREFSND